MAFKQAVPRKEDVIRTCGLRHADGAVSPEQHQGLGTTEWKLVGAGPARRHSVTTGRLRLPVKLKTRAVSQQLGPVPTSLQVRRASSLAGLVTDQQQEKGLLVHNVQNSGWSSGFPLGDPWYPCPW